MKTIHVTQAHIDKGIKNSCELCPVALAFIDAGFPEISVKALAFIDAGFPEISVGKIFASLSLGHQIFLPQSVREWIHEFDASIISPDPFSFEIDEPNN